MEGIETLFEPGIQQVLGNYMNPQEFDRFNHYIGIITTYPGGNVQEQITNWHKGQNENDIMEWVLLCCSVGKAIADFVKEQSGETTRIF